MSTSRPTVTRFTDLAAIGALVAILLTCGCASSRRPAIPADAGTTYEDAFRAATKAMEDGHSDRARTLFEIAVQRNQHQPYPHYYLGVLYAEAGKIELAIVAFQKALAIEPNFSEALYNLGTLHLQRRELPPAIDDLEKAVALDPDNVAAFNNLGKAYYMGGSPELAGAAYEEALMRDPDNRVALENLFKLATAAGNKEAADRYRTRLSALDSSKK